ncbi:MAG: hypothetical protein K8R92_03120 [Planctomycetes bacterium]|nr:hypothetical protein [Planctomycetota bacterium]
MQLSIAKVSSWIVAVVVCLFILTSAFAAPPGSFTLSNEAPICDTTPPANPAIRLNWTQSNGATTYAVYRNGSLYASSITGLTFYNNANLTAGQTYTYKVRATNASGSTDSNTISVDVPVNICASANLPGNFTLSNQTPICDTTPPANPAITLNWTQSNGATTYAVYRNGSLYASSITGLTFYNNANLTAGQTYTYKVRATNASGSTDSNTISIDVPVNICASANLPGNFTLSNQTPICDTTPPANPAITLNWTQSNGATTYAVYRNSSLYASSITGLTFYNNANMTAGQTYTYKVRATNASGSTDSNTISVDIPVNICASANLPGNFTLSNQTPFCNFDPPATPEIDLNWTASSGVATYQVWRDGVPYSQNQTQQYFYNQINLSPGQTYTYTVRATNSFGSTDSNAIVVTIPANICSATNLPGNFTLSTPTPICDPTPPAKPAIPLGWTASSGAATYTMFRNGSPYASTTGLTFLNNANLIAGQTYSYMVRATNTIGSTDSNTISVVIPENICITSDCPAGEIRDCNGNCAPAAWASDAYCDNGYYWYNGVSINFDCSKYNSDGGACINVPGLSEPAAHSKPLPTICIPQDPPTPTQKNLVEIVHGRNTSDDAYRGVWKAMADRIRSQLGSDWQVVAHNWTQESNHGVGSVLSYAATQGTYVGKAIAAGHYDHVHLIGHSAGAMVIATAAFWIKHPDGDPYSTPTNTVIHTTYLDAYTGIWEGLWTGQIYGANANWSDQYYSKEPRDSECYGPYGDIYHDQCSTYLYTEAVLPLCHNVDITELDQSYSPVCLSTHSWPHKFYRYSITGETSELGCSSCGIRYWCYDPPFQTYAPYGFGLSKEKLGSAWGSTVADDRYIRGANVALGGADLVAPPDATASFQFRINESIAVAGVPFTTSPGNAVAVTANGCSLTIPGRPVPESAWISIQFTPSFKTNIVQFELGFLGDAGVFTAYVDGEELLKFEPSLMKPGVTIQNLQCDTDLNPGTTHTLSFRLDEIPPGSISVVLQNMHSGWAGFAPLENGTVVAWGAGMTNSDYPNYGQSLVPATLGPCKAVAAGSYHSLAIQEDGKVVGWGAISGYNYGQSIVSANLGPCKAIAAGNIHSAAIQDNGTVVAWGDDYAGKCDVPATLGPCKAIATGSDHTVALQESGIVVGWGNNSEGQAKVPVSPAACKAVAAGNHTVALQENGIVLAWGNNYSGQCDVPETLGACKAIVAGLQYNSIGGHNVALRENGTVVAWGDNYSGQCDVPATLGVCKAIAAGSFHSVAIKEDGTVVAWGTGYQNDGHSIVPPNLGPCKAIAAGFDHTVAILEDGNVVAWGYNGYGETNVPVNLGACKAVAAGGNNYYGGHTVALQENGSVVCWGANSYGQCNVPVNLGACKAIAAGEYHTVALTENGTVVAWGDNYSGQCDIPAPLGVCKAIAAGNYHTVAIREDGAIVIWGDNGYQQSTVPVSPGVCKAISAGGNHTLALKEIGTVVAWGNNYLGQCNVPVNLGPCKAVAAGGGHSVALKEDGTVVAWGSNMWGQCNVPANLGTCKAIAAGSDHTVVIRDDGTVVAWGTSFQNYGQSIVPPNLGACKAVAAGFGHTLGIQSPSVPCPSDLDGSGEVDGGDIGLILLDFGPCNGCSTDLDGSGEVDGGDIGLVLLDFGPCP